jgi:hypothetical protein
MVSLAAPDGYVMLTGTWGTDADKSTTALSGSNSIQLKNTTVATKFATSYVPITKGGSTQKKYQAIIVYQADSNAGTDTITVQVKTYDASFSLVSTTTIINAQPVASANVWYTRTLDLPITSSTERYARIEIAKSATSFNAYVDTVDISPIAPHFYYLASVTATSATTGNWTSVVNYDSTDGSDVSISAGQAYPFYSQAGFLRAQIKWSSSIPDGTTIGVRLTKNGVELNRVYFKVGGAENDEIEVSWAGLIDAWQANSATRYYYGVEVYQNSGSSKDVLTRFQGFQAGF